MEFTENEIKEIYETKVKLPPSYFTKNAFLGPCPIKSQNNNWGNGDFPRNWCVLDFIEWTEKHTLKKIEHVGSTCPTDPELEFITYDKLTHIPYPPYDLHKIGYHFKNEFDFFIFNQTLEHLYNPFEAVKSIWSAVKPGGYVFTSVPTINIPHMVPIHFNGFTPMGLAMLFKTAKFEVVEIGQWGNFEYIQRLFYTHSWPGFNDLNRNGMVSNDERNVCQCWILARKPQDQD